MRLQLPYRIPISRSVATPDTQISHQLAPRPQPATYVRLSGYPSNPLINIVTLLDEQFPDPYATRQLSAIPLVPQAAAAKKKTLSPR